MAKLFGEIDSKNILTLDKSFSRSEGQPLDSTQVHYSYEDACDYAKTDVAYVGQIVTVVENNVVSHYSIEDAAGTLKEITENGVGEKFSGGGEIFNDYMNNVASGEFSHAEGKASVARTESSHAQGNACVAGGRGFDILTKPVVDTGTNKPTIKLNSVIGLEVGDIYSMKVGSNFIDFGQITEIDKSSNSVVVDKIPTSGMSSSTGVFWIGRKQLGTDLTKVAFRNSRYEITEISASAEDFDAQVATLKEEGYTLLGCGTKLLDSCQHAEGTDSIAVGYAAHAEGNESIASGRWSHAEGNGTYAGYSAHSEGNSTKATGEHAHAEGGYTEATAGNAHAEGNKTKATGANAHAEGESSTASGYDSHSEGLGTTASGNYSHAQGWKTTASGENSFALGRENTASGIDSTAGGRYSKAEGKRSFAHGLTVQAKGDNSFASGQNSLAGGVDSAAFGTNSKATTESQFVVGRNNNTDDTAIFIVGTGVNHLNPKNGFTVKKDGRSVVGAGPVDKMDVANKEYVDNKLKNFEIIEEPSGLYLRVGNTILSEDMLSRLNTILSEGKLERLLEATEIEESN